MISLLNARGVADIVVSETDEPDFNLDQTLLQMDAASTPFIKPGLETEWKKTSNAEYKGRSLGELRGWAQKAFGFTADQVKELEGPAILELAAAKLKEAGGATEQSLRQELLTMSQSHGTAMDALKADHARILKETTDKYAERDIITNLAAILSKEPRHGGDVNKQAKAWYADLKERYGVVLEADGRISLRDLKDPNLEAKNAAGSQLISLKDEGVAYLQAQGIFAPNMKGVNAQQQMQNGGAGGTGNGGSGARAGAQGGGLVNNGSFNSRMAAVESILGE